MEAQEALDNLIAALPDDFEDHGEISALTRAAETQDKLDWQLQQAREMRARELERQEQAAINKSWEGAVDRQGGAVTQEEMDPMRGWK